MLPILVSALIDRVPPEFDRYLARADSSYRYRELDVVRDSRQIELTSQTWQGRPWVHTILYREPTELAAKGVAILFITGDGPKDGDHRLLQLVTQATGMPTAMLHNIPNQPIDGRKEDDLIAETFEKYIATKDATWPLLFPMAKSAIRAMDAMTAITAKSPNPIKRFVVAGASKRGWTTWFVGASRDPRVIGIAPMVYDNLNITVQMPHQLRQWGAYSEQIQDYTRRGLQQKLSGPEGRHLAEIVDPYSYRDRIKIPTLIVNGGNDPYWAVDALSLYWNDLKQPHWCSIVPNAGHGLGSGLQAVGAIGAFARSLAGAFPMPKYSVTFSPKRNGRATAAIELGSALPTKVEALTVSAANGDFRPGKWSVVATVNPKNPGHHTLEFPVDATTPTAALIQFTYRVGGREFVTSWPVKVYAK